MKHLVLLGGCKQHLQVLRDLAADPLPSVHVSLITPSAHHVHMPWLTSWVAGERSLDNICIPWAPWAQKAQVELIESDVLVLDTAKRSLTLSSGLTCEYDALSIGASAVANRDQIPGAREHALFVRPVEHFIPLWDSLLALSQQQALSIVVLGDDVAAVELSLAAQRRLGKRARVALLTGDGPPLPAHPSAFQRRVKAALKRGQVTLFEDRCELIMGRQMQLTTGMRLSCDAPLVAFSASSPLWLSDSGLSLDAQGFMQTNKAMQSTSHPEVFGVGELARRIDGDSRPHGFYPLATPPDVLTLNLRRFLAGGTLQAEGSVTAGMHAIALGNGHTLGRLGSFIAAGRWVGGFKERADRALPQQFSAFACSDWAAMSGPAQSEGAV